jgi:hypothetical protein
VNVLNVFIIMPISATNKKHTKNYWTAFYKNLRSILLDDLRDKIKAAFSVDDVECRRSESEPGDLVDNIIYDLVSSDVVIAVLTDKNANVFYELGIRHAVQDFHSIMLWEKSGKSPPFDVGHFGMAEYVDDENLKSTLVRELRDRLLWVASNRGSPDNPVARYFETTGKDSRRTRKRGLGIKGIPSIPKTSIYTWPQFYIEEKTRSGVTRLTDRVVFVANLAILNYDQVAVSIEQILLRASVASDASYTATLYPDREVVTRNGTHSLHPTFEPRKRIAGGEAYDCRVAFVAESVPSELLANDSVKAKIEVVDMHGHSFLSDDIEFWSSRVHLAH